MEVFNVSSVVLSPKMIATSVAVAGLLALASPSFATTVTFGSYGGSTAPAGLSNSAIMYDNTASNAPSTTYKTGTAATYNPGYSNTLYGTS